VPQERKFESDAERQRAYRERKRLEQGQLSPQQPAVMGPPPTPPEAEALGPRIPTEEEYVRREVALAKAQISRGWIKTRDAKGGDLEPLRRSEQYARWRYRGFCAGEIASL
jgi:hypothetical protein